MSSHICLGISTLLRIWPALKWFTMWLLFDKQHWFLNALATIYLGRSMVYYMDEAGKTMTLGIYNKFVRQRIAYTHALARRNSFLLLKLWPIYFMDITYFRSFPRSFARSFTRILWAEQKAAQRKYRKTARSFLCGAKIKSRLLI